MLPYNRWYLTAIGAAIVAIGCAMRGDLLFKRAEETGKTWEKVTESDTNESSSSPSSPQPPESLLTNSES